MSARGDLIIAEIKRRSFRGLGAASMSARGDSIIAEIKRRSFGVSMIGDVLFCLPSVETRTFADACDTRVCRLTFRTFW
jgi:hypothetical protein